MKNLIILSVLSFCLTSCMSDECELDGCERKSIGWENSFRCAELGYSACKIYDSGGYCSKAHALEDL